MVFAGYRTANINNYFCCVLTALHFGIYCCNLYLKQRSRKDDVYNYAYRYSSIPAYNGV